MPHQLSIAGVLPMAAQVSYQDAIIEYLNQYDPDNEVVKIDPTTKEISYKSPIKCHQTPKYENEGFVRAYLIVRLVKELGYPMDCIEIENDLNVKVGRTKKHRGTDRGRSDVLVFQRTEGKAETLFLGIECKTPEDYEKGKKDLDGQLWGITKAESIQKRVHREIRYLALYTVEYVGGELLDKLLIVNFQKFPTYPEWTAASSPSNDILPAQYNDPPQSLYANIEKEDSKRGWKPLIKSYTREDFETLRARLHDQLWAGSSTDDNAIFYQLTKIFLVKIYDELTTDPEKPYKIQIRSTSRGEENPDELYERLVKYYEKASRQMLNYDDEKLRTFPFLVEGFTKTKLFVAVKELQGISLTENEYQGYDILGSFFESIMTNQEFFKQSKGSYFTHPNIVRFILAMVGVDEMAMKLIKSEQPRLPYIVDPSNGSGTFLIEAMKFVTSRVTKNYSKLRLNRSQQDFYNGVFMRPGKPNVWAEDYIFGIEPRAELGLAAKVNMILHGDGNMNIFIDDGLHPFRKNEVFVYDRKWQNKDPGMLADTHPSDEYEGFYVNENFDIAVSNPPFSLVTDALDSRETHDETFIYAAASNSENLFLERYYQLLRPGGKLGIVLPESVFDTSDNKYIRLFLYKYFHIDAIVSLPQEAFEPFTSTKVSLLFATKKTLGEIQNYSEAWNKAAKEYGKLRKSKSIQAVIENDRLLNGNQGLIRLCSEFNIIFSMSQSILDETIFTVDLSEQLEKLIDDLPNKTKKEERTKKKFKTQFKNISDFVNAKKFDALPKTEIDALHRFLKDYFPEGDFETPRQICERAYDEIVEIAKLDWPDYLDRQKYANAWWCFSTVSAQPEFDRAIFFAEAQNIGYKRTKRREMSRPNDLYDVDNNGFPFAKSDDLSTIFDQYVSWKGNNFF